MFKLRKIVSLLVVKLILVSAILLLFTSVDTEARKVYVNGYFRKDGTYVKPHYRTVPDGNPFNNYSYPGNYNPNKGAYTTGDSLKYLQRYYKLSKPKFSFNFSDTYYRPTTSYSIPPIASDILQILQQSENRVSKRSSDILVDLLRQKRHKTSDASQFYETLFNEVKKIHIKQARIHEKEVAELQKQIETLKQKLAQQERSTQRQIELRKSYDKALSNGDYAKALDLSYLIKNFDSRTRQKLRSVISLRQKYSIH